MKKQLDSKISARLDQENQDKLARIANPFLMTFLNTYINLLEPDDVFVSTGTPEENAAIREQAIEFGEERQLSIPSHTVHFDNHQDQARDKANTKLLLETMQDMGPGINTLDRTQGLEEIHEIMRGIARGHRLYILFFCLGPVNSRFSIPCVQLTDSAYVAHSENILYRQGFEEFLRLGSSNTFFRFVHSQGELDERNTSKNISKRRVYIDTSASIVYSANTQYGGNTIGLKKLAMRLAIDRASKEGWLTEHMFIMGVEGPKRRTYFSGAFPSLCGKTSTSMVQGEHIIGDDIAYLRSIDGQVRAVNVEKGIFGIMKGVNQEDDASLWKLLHSSGEVIFSNVLVAEDGTPHWSGKGGQTPEKGVNYLGRWTSAMQDDPDKPVPPSHPNARFTLALSDLENVDPQLDNPEGVRIRGIIYGGRDSDTWVPVEQSFDWMHGVITKGTALESETTAATLGADGVRKLNPMSNIDFLSIPMGRYIHNNIQFGREISNPPLIFSVNYFLRNKNGAYANAIADKRVWLKWMELRVHGEVSALRTPTGLIPCYDDLRDLFKSLLGKNYSYGDYQFQFTIRVPQNLAKIERVLNVYRNVPETPPQLFIVLEEQKKRLIETESQLGAHVLPENFSVSF